MGKLLQTLPGRQGEKDSISWSSDGKAIALSNSDTIQIWDTKTGKLLQNLKPNFTSSAVRITGLTWSSDSKKLVSSSTVGTFIWDVSKGKELRHLEERDIATAVLSPDGKSIATTENKRSINIWDVTTGQLLKTMQGHDSFIDSFTWSKDSKILISAGALYTIKIWDVTTGKQLKTLFGHGWITSSISWNPQTKIIASYGIESDIRPILEVKLWQIDLHNLVSPQ
jgi:WD40 repeat protein